MYNYMNQYKLPEVSQYEGEICLLQVLKVLTNVCKNAFGDKACRTSPMLLETSLTKNF